jgi:FkbM family methyltransferase
MNNDEDLQPWGTYRPSGKNRLVVSLAKLGLGHGPVKKWLRQWWLAGDNRRPADVVYAGLRFRLHPWDSAIEGKMLLGSARLRDPLEMQHLRTQLARGGVFLDIGANIGYYSLMAAAAGASRVLAVEPNPLALRRLAFNSCANGFESRITPVAVALGAERGKVTLTVTSGDIGGSGVGSHLPGERIEVAMLPLRDLFAEQGIADVAAMKIDVEGMEDTILLPLLENTPRASWPRLVIMEHTSRDLWQRDVLTWMREAGYTEAGRSRSNVILRLA